MLLSVLYASELRVYSVVTLAFHLHGPAIVPCDGSSLPELLCISHRLADDSLGLKIKLRSS
ncbi:hypothetical protein PanWU01x14_338750 [Parasponia andersonii]|uniref:Uncharacterized protein n=1 Tax=Parasponia andersonii TaxID=3476 RepID=A0A2P5AF27_PARAD|nr:hypothetical protein PanWU01x14_338750 [Parasponia andersonii]